MIVSAPFRRQMQPKRSAPRVAASSRCAVHPLGVLAEKPRQLTGMGRQHRPATPVARLELVQGVSVEHDRHLGGGEQLVAQAHRLRRASEPRADRNRPRLRRGAERVGPGHLHRLQEPHLDHRQ